MHIVLHRVLLTPLFRTATRKHAAKIMKNCRKLIQQQLLAGGQCGGGCEDQCEYHAGGEQPLRCTSWKKTDIGKAADLCGGRFRCDGCMNGLRNPKTGNLVQKSWGWFSSNPRIRKALQGDGICNHPKGQHDIIAGDITASTACYPTSLCDKFAKALMSPSQRVCEIFSLFHATAGEIRSSASRRKPSSKHELDHEFPVFNNETQDADEIPQDPEHPAHSPEDHKAKILIKKLHSNFGHPNNETLRKLLKDAGATPRVLQLAKEFQCPICCQRGRPTPSRPASLPSVLEKWHTISIDTFWYNSQVGIGDEDTHQQAVGISFFDEATDFHQASIVRQSTEHPGNVSFFEFKRKFEKDWLRCFPKPVCIRYDAEGCFTGKEFV